MNKWVFRIAEWDPAFSRLRTELKAGRARQGWHPKGTDVRLGEGAFVAAWKANDWDPRYRDNYSRDIGARRRFKVLAKMLKLQATRSLPLDDPSRAACLKKISEAIRMLFPDAFRTMIRDLFTESGRRLLSAENDFVFELFPERELMHDFYAAAPPKIFVRIKNPNLTLAENLAQFAEGAASDVRLLICPNEEFDEKKIVAAKERNVILVDGLTLANAFANHKTT